MLKGKVALITGGGTGIGRACALRLAQEGVQIAVNYSRSERESRDTQKDVEDKGVRAMIYKASVTDDNDVRQMVNGVIEEFGRLDILINSAGRTRFIDHADLDGLKDEYWNEIMDVNVVGLFRSCRAAAGALKKQKGCIVNITSIAGLSGLGSSIAYAASKAAAISVTKSLARVLAPEVRVNSVAPGIVLTRWIEGHEDHVKHLGSGTPLGRVANPEDVAQVVYALVASAGLVTGQTWVVDGGMRI